jgi:hypothetical protein
MTEGLSLIDYRTGGGFIHGVSLDTIMETINRLNAILITSDKFIEKFGDRKKAGAVLRIVDIALPERPTSLLVKPFGYVPFDSRSKYEKVSMRKVGQLIQHPDHISSFQSRDGENYWGGGYPIPKLKLAVSISGHPELGDEVLGLGLGMELDWIGINYVKDIVALSDNFLFSVLTPHLRKLQA